MIDFEIDSDLPIDGHRTNLNKFTVFEDVDIDIPDDLEQDELTEIEKINNAAIVKDVTTTKIPAILFDLNEEIEIVRVNSSDTLICEVCSKKYVRPKFFQKHIAKCGKGDMKNETELPVIKAPASSLKQMKKSMDQTIEHLDEELVQLAPTIVQESIQEIIENPLYSIGTVGRKVISKAKQALQEMRKSENKTVCIDIVSCLGSFILSRDLLKESEKDKLWVFVNSFLVESPLKIKFNSLFDSDDNENDINFIFYEIAKGVIKRVMAQQCKAKTEKRASAAPTLTKEEEQTIRYVSGYIVFSLLRKYEKIAANCSKSRTIATYAKEFLETLRTTGVDGDSLNDFLSYTRHWVAEINRGGLVEVSDDMFLFCRAIENCVRMVLNLNFIRQYRGEDIRDCIGDVILNDNAVKSEWHKLARNFPNSELSEILMNQIITKWVDIRARAYVSVYVQVTKRKAFKQNMEAKLSRKTEPALRKTLT